MSMFVVGVLAQIDSSIAGSALTAGAGFVGIVAIGQMVRAISHTESQKTELIDALQQQLAAEIEQNRMLREEIRILIRDKKDQ